MSWSEIGAAAAVVIATGTLIREWLKDQSSESRADRSDAAAFFERWQESEMLRSREAEDFRLKEAKWFSSQLEREKVWEEKCAELFRQLSAQNAKIELLKLEIEHLKSGGDKGGHP